MLEWPVLVDPSRIDAERVRVVSSIVDQAAQWRGDTQKLEGWTEVRGRKVYVCIPREMIHSLPMYNDALEWEIEWLKNDILHRLDPCILKQVDE